MLQASEHSPWYTAVTNWKPATKKNAHGQDNREHFRFRFQAGVCHQVLKTGDVNLLEEYVDDV